MKLENLKKLFVDELQDLRSAENQLVKALPKMAKGAHSPELRQCFETHLEETKGHLERLDRILERVHNGAGIRRKVCHGIKGLITEGAERVKATGDPAVLDAGLIAAAQRVEHYEIAGYGCAKTYAALLGEDSAARMLEQSLEEEKAADQKLNDLALNLVNPEAARA
jgi:ferritin-like metal-binding protein YciE